MTAAVSAILTNADYFVLLIFRVGALVVTSPVFGRVNIPMMAKIGFVGTLAYLFFTAGYSAVPITYTTLGGFFLIIASEILIGIALSFITNLFFASNFIAGHLIDMQIGFGIVNVYDAQNNTQLPLIGNLLNIVMLLIFFLMDGHLRLIYIISLTIEKLPVGNLLFMPDIGLTALEIFTNSFVLGIMIALPILASGITLEICFGALIRSVPQMNMFVVGIPVKLILGFVILFAIIPVYVGFCDRVFEEMFLGLDKMFSTFAAS